MLNDSKKYLVLGGLFLFPHFLFAANAASTNEQEQMPRQIFMLEKALAPTNPQGVAAAWAKAVKNRNGAVQYMLQCPDLKKTTLNHFLELNWVTGVSSPWVSSYKITPLQAKDKSWKFTIQYQLTASGNMHWNSIDEISVVRLENNIDSSQEWCISQLKQHDIEKA